MPKKTSAGLLVYRRSGGKLEVLIARMGGPWFKNKENGAWSIPKGVYEEDEDPKDAAKREFEEELSLSPPDGQWLELGSVKQKNNKEVIAWAIEGDLDVSHTESNTTKAEWPPHSGKIIEFPEIEKAEWMTLDNAAPKLVAAQVEFLQRLSEKLNVKFDIRDDSQEDKPKQNSLF